MATLDGATIKKLKSNKSNLTGSAAIVTCFILLNLAQAYAEGQRCYVCGPRSSQWYSNGTPPPCNEFKTEPHFEVVCGKGYNFCATIKTPGSQEISRVCVETHEPRGCISKACAKTKTLFTVCSCNGTLCNGEPSLTTVAPETPTQDATITTEKAQESQETTPTTQKIEAETTTPKIENHDNVDDKSHEKVDKVVEETVGEKLEPKLETEPKTIPEEVEHPTTEKSNKDENENAIQNDEKQINKTRESKKERDLGNSVETHKHETVTTHSLPLPEALGQEHKKNLQKQGAPVDDEEDSVEGSGTRGDEAPKAVAHSPTTHMSQTLTTTTAKPPNNGASTHHFMAISLWTIFTLILVS